MARRIVLTSGKGGVGKTTVTANLGCKLAQLGLRVVLVDLDLGLNNLDVVMGIENKIVYDIIDCIENRCRVKQALLQHTRFPSLYVLPSAHGCDKSVISGQNIKIIIEKLSVGFDYILMDGPAGIEVGFHRAVAAADEAIVVTTPHISSLRDADKVLKILKTYEMVSTNLVINRVRGDLIASGDMISIETIADTIKCAPLGVLPDDDEITLSSASGGIVGSHTNISEAYKILANNLHNNQNQIFDCTSIYTGFLGRIRRNIKRKA